VVLEREHLGGALVEFVDRHRRPAAPRQQRRHPHCRLHLGTLVRLRDAMHQHHPGHRTPYRDMHRRHH
jgi:hypothetical protein